MGYTKHRACMFTMDKLHLSDFDSSQEANFHFRFFTSMSRRPVFSETRDLRVSLALIQVIQQASLGGLVCANGVALALSGTYTDKNYVIFCKNAQNQQFSRQHAPPGKVKITSSAASDLKISHRLIHWLNRVE